MGNVSRATVKTYFNRGDKPTEAQFVDLIDSDAGYFDTMQDMVDKDQSGNADGQLFGLFAFYSGSSYGGGLFKWDASESKSNHDGGIVIDPNHTTTPGSSGWWTAENSGSGCYKRVIFEYNVHQAEWFGPVLDGVSDDTKPVQAALDSISQPTGGIVKIGPGIVLITQPLVLPLRVRFIGSNSGPSTGNSGTNIKVDGSFSMPPFYSNNGFNESVAVLSKTFKDLFDNTNETWHWSGVEEIIILCENNCDYGLAIHQFGEQSRLRGTAVFDGNIDNYLITGTQAVFHLENCSSWRAGRYGISFDVHPSGNGNNGGSGRLLGFSGDAPNGVAHIHIGGTQSMDIVGLKSEFWPVALLIDGSGTGSGSNKVYLSGRAEGGASGVDVVKIEGSARPHITLASLHCPNYTNIINDVVGSRTLAKTAGNEPGLIVWGTGTGYETNISTDLNTWGINQVITRPQLYQESTSDSSYNTTLETIFASKSFVLNHRGEEFLTKEGSNYNFLIANSGDPMISGTLASELGFFGASPVSRPSLTYSRSGETTAESQLRTALANLGLVNDNTTA